MSVKRVLKVCRPVVREIPSHLSEAAAVAFPYILGLIYSLHHVEQMFIWMFYVEVKSKGVQQDTFCLKYTLSLRL